MQKPARKERDFKKGRVDKREDFIIEKKADKKEKSKEKYPCWKGLYSSNL